MEVTRRNPLTVHFCKIWTYHTCSVTQVLVSSSLFDKKLKLLVSRLLSSFEHKGRAQLQNAPGGGGRSRLRLADKWEKALRGGKNVAYFALDLYCVRDPIDISLPILMKSSRRGLSFDTVKRGEFRLAGRVGTKFRSSKTETHLNEQTFGFSKALRRSIENSPVQSILCFQGSKLRPNSPRQSRLAPFYGNLKLLSAKMLHKK